MTLGDFIKDKTCKRNCSSGFQTKKNKKAKTITHTLMLQLTLDRKSLLMVKLKPSGERDFLFLSSEREPTLRFFRKELKSGQHLIATLMGQKIMSCFTKTEVVLSLCLEHLKTSSISRIIRLNWGRNSKK